jgi:hypothetical protein
MGRHFNTGAGMALALETLFAFRSLKSSMESQQADDTSDSDSNEEHDLLVKRLRQTKSRSAFAERLFE